MATHILYLKHLCSFSAIIGLLYPFLDKHLDEPFKYQGEWSSVMRCVAVFVGINHASAVSFNIAKSKVSLNKAEIHWIQSRLTHFEASNCDKFLSHQFNTE